jgi:hypothetical protein
MALLKNKMAMLIILSMIQSMTGFAQLTQTIRGSVIDPLLQTPITGVTISVNGTGISSISDSSGQFRLRTVPVGTHTLQVTHIGYKSATLPNIVVNAGKEVVLTLSLEAKVQVEKEVVVTANSKKNRPLNDMSIVSTRAFTVQETQKYAAAINDPLRMVTSFAGVVAANDGGNDIVIRGNSPTGLLWRMEGIDIPNPNHFGSAGSTGGGVSILSSQLLSNSDFTTGAFAAEYGNGLSGVFDLKLRKGNNERREYTFEAGVLGLNAAAEGPFAKNYTGSYLVNYRYSTLSLLQNLGVELVSGTTNFQDLAYNIYLPAKRFGTFTLFGFGGLSSQNSNMETDPEKWEEDVDRYGGKFKSNTGAAGITHTISLNYKTTLRTAAVYSFTENGFSGQYVEDDRQLSVSHKDNYETRKTVLSTTLNHKFNNRLALRTGAIVSLINFNFYRLAKENEAAPLLETINTTGNTTTVQAFAQWQYKPLDKLSFNAGVHYLQLLYNNTKAIEPRASVKWEINRKNTVSLGYGLHSQLQTLGVYFAEDRQGAILHPNKEVGFTQSHHFVLGYSHLLGRNLRVKAELYYQHLFNVPVSLDPDKTFSTLNIQNDIVTEPLANKGKGKNYGIELSVEKNLDNYFYFILNSSLYQSKYTALDGVERNTRFNGNYLFNGTAGKEFPLGTQRRILGINLKLIYAGGFRTTPIDAVRSQQEGYTVYYEKQAFTQQNAAYFRPDLRVSLKMHTRNITSTLSLDIQNVINRKNVYSQTYDLLSSSTITQYQNGIIPVFNYKIEF